MARLALILGISGSGKSSSLRNFKDGEAQIISCAGKEFPFRSELKTFVPQNYQALYTAIEASSAPVVVIDDANFMMVKDEFKRAREVGYAKFTDYALDLARMFDIIIGKQSDQTFYVLSHPEDRSDANPNLEFKISAGKMTNKFPVTAKTNIVMEAIMDENNQFVFKVQTDGRGVKTPMGMFDTPTVENDLKKVDAVVREYYGVDKQKTTTKKEGK